MNKNLLLLLGLVALGYWLLKGKKTSTFIAASPRAPTGPMDAGSIMQQMPVPITSSYLGFNDSSQYT